MPVYSLSGDGAPAALSDELTAKPSQPHRANDAEQFTGRERLPDSETQAELDAAIRSWRERAVAEASKMHVAAERYPTSAAASARLANAERLAGNNAGAVEAAEHTFALLARAGSGASSIDFAAGVAAARLLANAGYGHKVEELIAELPDLAILQRVRAGIVADRGEFERALQVLGDDDSMAAASMRGYLLLRIGQAQQAIRHLKRAWFSDASGSGADNAINLAVAFWTLRSPAKAISYARQASRAAPGRQDISFKLLNFLLSAGEIDAAKREIDRIKRMRYLEPPEFLFFQAQVALRLAQEKRARRLMREALELAAKAGDTELAAEIEGNIAYLSYSLGRLRSRAAQDEIVSCMCRAPNSLALLELYASLADRVDDATYLARKVADLEAVWNDEVLYEVKTRLAFLECDYSRALTLSEAWLVNDPCDSRAVSLFLMLAGPLFDKWEESSSVAHAALRRFGERSSVVNNIAYALALAGNHRLAETALSGSDVVNFYFKATEGLVQLAKGQIDAGLRLYREAAVLADGEEDGGAARSLMTLHEGMAIRHFRLLDDEDVRSEVIAGSLPPVSLPGDWERRPEFVLLAKIAEFRDWPWPLSVK